MENVSYMGETHAVLKRPISALKILESMLIEFKFPTLLRVPLQGLDF